MTVTTRFNVGDKIFVLENGSLKPTTIKTISTFTTSLYGEIYCGIRYHDEDKAHDDKDCFASPEAYEDSLKTPKLKIHYV